MQSLSLQLHHAEFLLCNSFCVRVVYSLYLVDKLVVTGTFTMFSASLGRAAPKTCFHWAWWRVSSGLGWFAASMASDANPGWANWAHSPAKLVILLGEVGNGTWRGYLLIKRNVVPGEKDLIARCGFAELEGWFTSNNASTIDIRRQTRRARIRSSKARRAQVSFPESLHHRFKIAKK